MDASDDRRETTEIETAHRGTRPAILPRRVSVALAEIRRGMLDEERAEELETQAREIRRRARLRQIRAIEDLLGMAPKAQRGGGA